MSQPFKSGFVNIFGAPNSGKSTLLNLLLGERLVIISPKVQTTRHRILGILNDPAYQVVFSDTPGIIEPRYRLHEKMMEGVKSALEDADVAILMHDINLPEQDFEVIANSLKLAVPKILLLNKMDALKDKSAVDGIVERYKALYPGWEVLAISARKSIHTDQILPVILSRLPEAPPYYNDDSISDRSERFFVGELIREQIYALFEEEIPYHAAVLIQSFEEKATLDVIKADIIVSRETQKMILLGKGGVMIKELGIRSRKAIEEFLQKKVHLELFVKVRPKWRENDNYLKEYGYH